MAGHSGWRVTQQITDQIINTAGGLTQTGVQVYFVTGNGNEGSVFVPNQIYAKTETVRRLVAAAATQLDDVGRLAENAIE